MKRGMSSIISTLLIIILIFVLAGAVIFLINSSLFKTQRQATIDKSCSEINIVVGDFCHQSLVVSSNPKDHLIFSVQNNMNSPLEGILLSLQYTNGNSLPLAVLGNGKVNSSSVVKLTTDFINDLEGISEVKVMPEVKVNNETLACKGNTQTFNWSNIVQCP